MMLTLIACAASEFPVSENPGEEAVVLLFDPILSLVCFLEIAMYE